MTDDRLMTCARLAEATGTFAVVGEEFGVGVTLDALVRLALRKAAK
jgi:hypothetical protein